MKNEENKTEITLIQQQYGKHPNIFIEHAKTIYFRNFSGNRDDKFNELGIGKINIIIPSDCQDLINDLTEAGWNLRLSKPVDDDESTREYYIPCIIDWRNDDRPPKISMKIGDKLIRLTNRTKNRLDELYVTNIDVTIHPFDYRDKYPDAAGPGIKAYIRDMVVTGEADPMTQKYGMMMDADESGDLLDEDVPF